MVWKSLVSDFYRDNMLVGEYLGGSDEIIDGIKEGTEASTPTLSLADILPSRMSIEDGVNISVSYHPRFPEKQCARFVISCDTFSNQTERFHYVELETFEILKILRRSGEPAEIDRDLNRVIFEDDVLNLPLFGHTGSLSAVAAMETIKAVCEFLEHSMREGSKKLVSVNIGVNYDDRAVFFSFAGCASNLVAWFNAPEFKLPEQIDGIGDWSARALGSLTKRFNSSLANDALEKTLKTSGLLNLERVILRPDEFQIAENGDSTNIRVKVSDEKGRFIKNMGIVPARIGLVPEILCSACGKSYLDCPHSIYLDHDIEIRFGKVDFIGLIWAARQMV